MTKFQEQLTKRELAKVMAKMAQGIFAKKSQKEIWMETGQWIMDEYKCDEAAAADFMRVAMSVYTGELHPEIAEKISK